METISEEATNLLYDYLNSINVARLHAEKIELISNHIVELRRHAMAWGDFGAHQQATRALDTLEPWYVVREAAVRIRNDNLVMAGFHYELHADEYHAMALEQAAVRGIEINFSGESVHWLRGLPD